MPEKITAVLATCLAMLTDRLRPDPDQDREGGSILGEYGLVLGLGAAAAVIVFAAYQGWLDGIIGSLPTP